MQQKKKQKSPSYSATSSSLLSSYNNKNESSWRLTQPSSFFGDKNNEILYQEEEKYIADFVKTLDENDFVKEISEVLRPQDEIWMSEIFYAGGTALKDISANDLIKDIKALGKNAFFVEDRNNFVAEIKIHLTNDCVLLLMGARDPSLEKFSKSVYENL